jgi:peptidyl-dipeptidase A
MARSLLPVVLLLASCSAHTPTPTSPAVTSASEVQAEVQAFLTDFEARFDPAMTEYELAIWDAYTIGDPAAYARSGELEVAVRELLSDPGVFEQLEAWKAAELTDPLLARQVKVLHDAFSENQLDPQMQQQLVAGSVEIGELFSTSRGQIDGADVTANEIKQILRTETDEARRRAAWEASKQVGPAIADKLVALVKLRNQAAQSRGYADFYEMRMVLSEHDPGTIKALYEEVDELTAAPFAEAKAQLDAVLAERYGISPDQLRPWHYEDPFFQEAPAIQEVDLDGIYAQVDILPVASEFLAGIGLPVDDVIEHSDLYERQGKHESAFCTTIDRDGDVRILCNLKNDAAWMDTLLHELGHAVYYEHMSPELPFFLRTHAHSFVTEGIALWMGRLSLDPAWMAAVLPAETSQALPEDLAQATADTLRLQMLVFARWSLVMVNFERALYENPDADLDGLWWDMVERYQLVPRPEGRTAPDWATKGHFVSSPVYYHNYLMGQLFASQLQAGLVTALAADDGSVAVAGDPRVGAFLEDRVFDVGRTLTWEQMVEQATGEPLTVRHFVGQYVD